MPGTYAELPCVPLLQSAVVTQSTDSMKAVGKTTFPKPKEKKPKKAAAKKAAKKDEDGDEEIAAADA